MCVQYPDGAILVIDDPSPPGVSLSPGSYAYVDPCPCVIERICPHCGEQLIGSDDNYSKDSRLECGSEDCGWTWIYAMDVVFESPEPPDVE
jgi:ribosomal protein S27AE